MKITFSLVAEKTFLTICVISTLLLISYCVYQYALNEDTSVIAFQRYNANEDNIYPAVTLCFGDYFKPNMFENSSDEDDYKDFLSGNIWNDKMDRIRYDDTVKDIEDYLLQIYMQTYSMEENKYSEYEYRTQNANNTWKPKFYRSLFMDSFSVQTICWTFEIEYYYKLNLNTLQFTIKSSIFKDSLRRPFGNLYVILAYPGQNSAATAYTYTWKPIKYTSLTMEFSIQNVVVLKRRKKWVNSCTLDWKKNDKIILKKTLKKLGCKPRFFPVDSSLPLCKNSSTSLSTLNDLKARIQPCKTIEKVLYSSNEYRNENVGKRFGVEKATGAFEMSFMFQGTTFTEIDQVRKIDFQSLVGNAGGFVGLFLGAAISQIPDAIKAVRTYFKN